MTRVSGITLMAYTLDGFGAAPQDAESHREIAIKLLSGQPTMFGLDATNSELRTLVGAGEAQRCALRKARRWGWSYLDEWERSAVPWLQPTHDHVREC